MNFLWTIIVLHFKIGHFTFECCGIHFKCLAGNTSLLMLLILIVLIVLHLTQVIQHTWDLLPPFEELILWLGCNLLMGCVELVQDSWGPIRLSLDWRQLGCFEVLNGVPSESWMHRRLMTFFYGRHVVCHARKLDTAGNAAVLIVHNMQYAACPFKILQNLKKGLTFKMGLLLFSLHL